MLGIMKKNSLYGVPEGKDIGLHLEPPTEDMIKRARFALISTGTVGAIALIITGLLTWLFLPPIIGYGLMFAECSLVAVFFRRLFPDIEDTGWMLWLPIAAIAFMAWQVYSGDTIESALVYLVIGFCILGMVGIYYAAWAALKCDDDKAIFRFFYKMSMQYPEIASYTKKVAASGRDWFVLAEITAMQSYIGQYEGFTETIDIAEGIDFKTMLFSSKNEIEGK